MAEVINLRAARKQAKRTEAEKRAEQNRAAYGRSKAERKLEQTRADQARRVLDAHRIQSEDGG